MAEMRKLSLTCEARRGGRRLRLQKPDASATSLAYCPSSDIGGGRRTEANYGHPRIFRAGDRGRDVTMSPAETVSR